MPASVPLEMFKRKEKPYFSTAVKFLAVPGKGEIIKPKTTVLPSSAPLLLAERRQESSHCPRFALVPVPLPAPPLRQSKKHTEETHLLSILFLCRKNVKQFCINITAQEFKIACWLFFFFFKQQNRKQKRTLPPTPPPGLGKQQGGQDGVPGCGGVPQGHQQC